jgi:hypothetical protein
MRSIIELNNRMGSRNADTCFTAWLNINSSADACNSALKQQCLLAQVNILYVYNPDRAGWFNAAQELQATMTWKIVATYKSLYHLELRFNQNRTES